MADRTIKPDDTHDLVLQNNHGSSKIEINENDTVVVTSGTAITLDATTSVELNADNGYVYMKDAGVTFLTVYFDGTDTLITGP
jgi:hypothetical protein